MNCTGRWQFWNFSSLGPAHCGSALGNRLPSFLDDCFCFLERGGIVHMSPRAAGLGVSDVPKISVDMRLLAGSSDEGIQNANYQTQQSSNQSKAHTTFTHQKQLPAHPSRRELPGFGNSGFCYSWLCMPLGIIRSVCGCSAWFCFTLLQALELRYGYPPESARISYTKEPRG